VVSPLPSFSLSPFSFVSLPSYVCLSHLSLCSLLCSLLSSLFSLLFPSPGGNGNKVTPYQNHGSLLHVAKSTTKKSGWSCCLIVAAFFFAAIGIGMAAGGAALSAQADGMNPAADFEVIEEGCTVFGLETKREDVSEERCDRRRSNCSGTDRKCCKTDGWTTVNRCNVESQYRFVEGECGSCKWRLFSGDSYSEPAFVQAYSQDAIVMKTGWDAQVYEGECADQIAIWGVNPGDHGCSECADREAFSDEMTAECWQAGAKGAEGVEDLG